MKIIFRSLLISSLFILTIYLSNFPPLHKITLAEIDIGYEPIEEGWTLKVQ